MANSSHILTCHTSSMTVYTLYSNQ